MFDADEMKRRFMYHAPNDVTKELHQDVRVRVLEFADFLNAALPDSREKSAAFTALEESQFWAHAALARNL